MGSVRSETPIVNSTPKSLSWIIWGGMALTIAGITVAFIVSRNRGPQSGHDPFKIYSSTGNHADKLPVLFEVSDFALTNQSGQLVTRADLLGKVWLADVIFTRCGGPCPEMTRRMETLQAAVPVSDLVRFITLTTDPLNDTPTVLQAYARRFNAQPGRWHFLTGTKPQIVDLAVRGLKFTALDTDPGQRKDPNDLFIHSTVFMLVDKHGRARAVIESDDADMKARALDLVNRLLLEK